VLVGTVRINLPHKVIELEELNYAARSLNDLEEEWMYVDSRHAGRKASDFISRRWQ
jgi:hypothetical protein